MIVVESIGVIAIIAMLIYVISFLIEYKIIPESLSATAEWSKRYHWWQVTICSIMGFLCYWFATNYPYNYSIIKYATEYNIDLYLVNTGYKLLSLIGCAGACGLGLAGYYSYTPGEETHRTLMIHKIGSFSGACLVVLFYILKSIFYPNLLAWWVYLCILGVCLLLGIFIKGKRIINQNDIQDMFDTFVMIDKKGRRYRYTSSNSIVFWMEIGILIIISCDIIHKFIEML